MFSHYEITRPRGETGASARLRTARAPSPCSPPGVRAIALRCTERHAMLHSPSPDRRGAAVTDPRPTDTPPGTAAAARTIMDGLDATHEQMRYWLDELRALVEHLDEQGWDTWSRDHARSIIDFF